MRRAFHGLFLQVMEEVGIQAAKEKSDFIRGPLIELKLELRSLYSSLAAISGNDVSATILRGLEGIRHLLASLGERARELEEEMADPVQLARSIVADDVVARVKYLREGERRPERENATWDLVLYGCAHRESGRCVAVPHVVSEYKRLDCVSIRHRYTSLPFFVS